MGVAWLLCKMERLDFSHLNSQLISSLSVTNYTESLSIKWLCFIHSMNVLARKKAFLY